MCEIFRLVNKMLLNDVFDFCLNWMFNSRMHQDKQLIFRLGGVVKFARRLGFDTKKGGAQRVQNWKSRGIPAAIERDNPWITEERCLMRGGTCLCDPPLHQATQEVAHG